MSNEVVEVVKDEGADKNSAENTNGSSSAESQPPQHTLYVNNLNEKVKLDGNSVDLWGFRVLSKYTQN